MVCLSSSSSIFTTIEQHFTALTVHLLARLCPHSCGFSDARTERPLPAALTAFAFHGHPDQQTEASHVAVRNSSYRCSSAALYGRSAFTMGTASSTPDIA